MAAPKDNKRQFWIYLIGALLTGGLGGLLTLPLGDGLARLSYDLPFIVQSGGSGEVVMVFMNPLVKRNLHEPEELPLDRRYNTRLVEVLHRDGVKLIFFDFINFTRPHSDPNVDLEFARAVRTNGRVVLPGFMAKSVEPGVASEKLSQPIPEFTEAASGWGLVDISQDGDGAIRRMNMGTDEYPSVPWVAAKVLNAPVTRNETARLRERWVNYYGRPGSFRSVNFDHAVTNGLPEGFFRDKIVIVCAGSVIGVAGAGQDEFAGPFSRLGDRRMYGGEMLAQSVLNLLHGDWLERLPPHWEIALVMAWGFLCAFGLSGRRPWNAAMIALAVMMLITAAALYLQLKQHVWWNWLILMVQTSAAFIWSVGYQYATESRRRRRLRQAFGSYLSPYMADQIANSEFDLALGGKEVEATVMFTDLEGFTKMSESLPPSEVSKILTSYFNQTTRVIIEQDGTIIKYIGDSVMAVWGAPLPEARHAERAVLAAWGMSQAGKEKIAGRRLRTRIGVNSGLVLAGNLGSNFRFDYTLIGDTTNFASRLEGLNKHLGTDVLLSEFTRRQLSDQIKVRSLGRFVLAGKTTAVEIFELMGPAKDFPHEPPWAAPFSQALEHFARQEFGEAERLMTQTIELRGGKDGPAEFYLKEIHRERLNAKPEGWDGTVKLDYK